MSRYLFIRCILFFWLLLAAIGFYPLVMWGRIKLNNALDIILLVAVLSAFVFSLNKIKIKLTLIELPLVLFFFGSSWLPGLVISETGGGVHFLIFIVMLVIIKLLFLLPKPVMQLYDSGRAWTYVFVCLCILLLVSYFFVGVTEHGRVTMPGIEDGQLVYRFVDGVGLLPDPNVLSYGLVFLYLLTLAYSGFRLLIFILLLLALIVVGSRSAILALPFAICGWAYFEGKLKRIHIFYFILLGLFVFVFVMYSSASLGIMDRFKNPQNYVDRYQMWLGLFEQLFSSNALALFFGNGYGAARVDLGDPHNFYLSALYDGGLLAVTGLVFLYIALCKYAAVNLFRASRASAYSMIIFNILIGIFYWQDQMFFVSFIMIWILSFYKARQLNMECC